VYRLIRVRACASDPNGPGRGFTLMDWIAVVANRQISAFDGKTLNRGRRRYGTLCPNRVGREGHFQGRPLARGHACKNFGQPIRLWMSNGDIMEAQRLGVSRRASGGGVSFTGAAAGGFSNVAAVVLAARR